MINKIVPRVLFENRVMYLFISDPFPHFKLSFVKLNWHFSIKVAFEFLCKMLLLAPGYKEQPGSNLELS